MMRFRLAVGAFSLATLATGCAGPASSPPALPATQTETQTHPDAASKKLVYVADYGTGILSVFGPDGRFRRSIKNLNSPISVAVDRQKSIYVMEQLIGTINIYHHDSSKPFRQIFTPYYAFECAALSGLSVGIDGTLYVAYKSCEASSFFGSVLVYPPGASQPSEALDAYGLFFANYLEVASNRNGDVFTTFTGYSSSNYGDVEEFFPGSTHPGHPFGLSLLGTGGIDITTTGDLVVCSAAGVQTFAAGTHALKSTINVPCGDISLADHNTMIYVTQGTVVRRYHYPSGKLSQTLSGFSDARSVAVEGAIED
jgi:hypothetical protein